MIKDVLLVKDIDNIIQMRIFKSFGKDFKFLNMSIIFLKIVII